MTVPPLLSIMEGRRARPRKAAVQRPKEIKLHMSVAKVLRDHARPEWRWTHVPSGELRDVRAMAKDLGLSLKFEEKGETGGRPLTIANLPKRECLILVSGYSFEMCARIKIAGLKRRAAG